MTEQPRTRSVVLERQLPHPKKRVWRALTEQQLIQEWLMENDFELEVDHRFEFDAEWGTVQCVVLTIEPYETLSYTWEARGLKSVVTWTLTDTETGTTLRMEQSGFEPDQERAYRGAQYGWKQFVDRLEDVIASLVDSFKE